MIDNIYTDLNESEKNPFITALHSAGITPHDQRQTLYKYVTVETALAILQNSSVKFSSPLIFNDPFEMNLGFLDYDVSREELAERMMKVLEGQNKKLKDKDLQNILSKIKTNDLVDPYRKGLEIQKQQTLLFCTSRSYRSTLMWSHYADSHKGVCIGFKIPTIFPEQSLFTLNVNYVSEIKLLKILAGSEMERSIAFYTWINTKSKVWEYEQEVRTCIPAVNLDTASNSLFSYVSFEPSSIVEIYFGAGTKNDHQQKILDLIKEKKYPIEKYGSMKISSSTFDLKCTIFDSPQSL